MKNGKEDSATTVLGCFVIILMIPIAIALRLFCLAKVYAWHVQPIFHGPTLTLWQWWGIGLFAVLFRPGKLDTESSKGKEMSELIGQQLFLTFWPLLVLAVAWFIR